MKAIDLLKNCREKIENMTQDQFDDVIKQKNLDKIQYDVEKYVDYCFRIKLPSENYLDNISELVSKSSNDLYSNYTNLVSSYNKDISSTKMVTYVEDEYVNSKFTEIKNDITYEIRSNNIVLAA